MLATKEPKITGEIPRIERKRTTAGRAEGGRLAKGGEFPTHIYREAESQAPVGNSGYFTAYGFEFVAAILRVKS